MLFIAGEHEVINSHCTGRGLSSYFECLTAPSSIASHASTFHSDGSISFAKAPEYYGSWSQSSSGKTLKMEYFSGDVKSSEFNGHAVDGACFEGLTIFTDSTYVSPYRVCLQ